MRIGDVLALSPELWVGALTDYDKTFTEALKKMVELHAYDPQTRAWWFPISYLPFVKQLAREHHVVDEKKLDAAHQVILAEIQRRRFLAVNTSVDGELAPALVEAFATLNLHPNAPRQFIEWAIFFQRSEAAKMAIPQTQLLRAEEAYRMICGGV